MLPKKSSPSVRFPLALALSCAVIAGCVLPGQLVGPSVTRVRDLTVEGARLVMPGQTTSLKVTIGTALTTQAFSLDWTRAELTLSNATLLNAPLTRNVTQGGGDSISASTAHFTGLRPGSGYSLVVTLYNGATEVASGTNASITLGAGANTVQVTVTPMVSPSPSPTATPALFSNVETLRIDEDNPPMAVLVADNGDLFVSVGSGGQIWRVDEFGTWTPWGDPIGTYIVDLASAPGGGLYVVEGKIGGKVLLVHENGAQSVFATGFAYPMGLVVAPDGNLYVADESNRSVSKVTSDGVADHGFYQNPAPDLTTDVTIDAQGNLYVSSSPGGYIVKIHPDGTASRYVENLTYPYGLCTDAFGNLYVGVEGQILRVSPSLEISTVAGSASDLGTADGPSASARFGGVSQLTLNPGGNVLYAIDHYYGSLRKVE